MNLKSNLKKSKKSKSKLSFRFSLPKVYAELDLFHAI